MPISANNYNDFDLLLKTWSNIMIYKVKKYILFGPFFVILKKKRYIER